jgi:phosphoserine aminotransferase
MVYAHAQKNLGPAGVTVCVIDRSLLERIPAGLPPMLDYRTHLKHRSNYNTPPVFGIYVMTLVTRWLRDVVGGLPEMTRINQAKAARLYGTLDGCGDLVVAHAATAFRSTMNASFRFRDERLDALFLEQAAAQGFSGLAGHRALGGIRASLYNAVSQAAVDELCGFLAQFAAAHG